MQRPFSLALVIALALAACNEPEPQGGGLSVTPSVVDFGQVVVGLLERRLLILDNQTPEIVRVIEARPDDPISDAIRLERVPAALVAGSTAEIEVVFAPDGEGTFSGPIRILTDGDPPELSVEANGVAVAPFLRAFPEAIDFGRVRLMQAAVWTATITNDGSTVVTVDAITPDMLSSGEFSVGPYAIERLEPGESFSFEITFQPIDGGRATGRIVIGDDSPRPVPLTIPVMGEGVDGDIELEPTNLDFTGALTGEERVRYFEIRNTGTATHTIDALTLEQSDPAAFYIDTSSVPFSLGPGEERRISVRFAPALPVAHSGMITVSTAEMRGYVSLFGIAFAPPVSALVVRPRAIDFGGVELGSSGARELTIESAGYIEVHVTGAIEIDPPDAPFMLLRAPAPGTTLKGFDSHTLEVLYLPQAEVSDAAILRIESDAANQPIVEIPLSGRGEVAPSSDADPRPISLDFGRVPRGTDSLRTIILFNGGTAPLSISRVELPENAGGLFELEEAPGTSAFAPGEQRAIRLRYSDPIGLTLVQTGTVAISTDDPDRPLIRVPLRAETVSPRQDDLDIRIHTTALDLHLINQGTFFDRPADCCWCNPNPIWDLIEESPLLDNDFTGGQTIHLARAHGTYAVEVHSREAAAVTAEVTIEMADSAPIVRMREVGPGQRWRVGTIEFFSFQTTGNFTTASLPLDAPLEDACY